MTQKGLDIANYQLPLLERTVQALKEGSVTWFIVNHLKLIIRKTKSP